MTSKKVREIRESLGLTRQQFADEVGASVRTIEAWETSIVPGKFAQAAIRSLQARSLASAAK